jgi:hypothetical protein
LKYRTGKFDVRVRKSPHAAEAAPVGPNLGVTNHATRNVRPARSLGLKNLKTV